MTPPIRTCLVVLSVLLVTSPAAPAAIDSPAPAPRVIHLTEPSPADSAAGTARAMLARGNPPRWSPYVFDGSNRVEAERPTAASPWSLRLDSGRLAAAPASWHVNAAFKNQALQELAPRTAYVLRFRARASGRRPITLELARHHTPYLNLGLAREVTVDETPREYAVRFLTGDTIPVPREPASSGAWLTIGAGQARGTVWLGDVTIEPSAPLRFAGRSLGLGTFDPGECWAGGETLPGAGGGLGLEAPPDGVGLAWRELPLDLGHGAWDLVLRVRAPAPRNVGRVVVWLRSGPDNGSACALASFSGIEAGWNAVVLPRERFVNYAWQGRIDWSAVRTVAIELESNGNGPARLELGGVTIEPRAAGRTLPPVIANLALEPAAIRARVAWTTDVPASCVLEYGATTAYGATVRLPGRSTRHAADLAALRPGRVYHARLRATGAGGAESGTGDFTFVTDPATPWLASAAGHRFPLGLFVVNTVEDLDHALATDFDCFISYRFSSCGNSDAEARAYLDRAASAGRRALMGLCFSAVARGDTAALLGRARALADHPGLLGWYLYDEPEGGEVDPAALRRVHDAIRRADPSHPVVLSSYALAPGYPYRDACELALVDRYPVPFAPVDSVVPVVARARASGRSFGFIFQSYDLDVQRWPGAAPGPGRYPSKAEMRAMAWLGVVFGAKQLWTYAYEYLHDTPGSEWHWADLLAVARELRLLEPLLLAPEAPKARVASSSSPAIHAGVRALEGRLYVVAVNDGPASVTASLALAGARATAATEVLSGRSIALRASAIADSWPPYAVRIYRLGP